MFERSLEPVHKDHEKWIEKRTDLQPTLADASSQHASVSRRPYRPLRHTVQEIRLLEVEGRAQSTSSLIRCISKHVCLLDEAKPTYETVSYCWGDASDNREILLNGLLLAVPASAEHALRRLQHLDKPRKFWLDAVCIDQSNVEERGHQVSLMASIYRSSTGNLVYLGEDDVSMQGALNSIEHLMIEITRETNDCRTLRDTVFTEWGQYRYSESGLSTDVDIQPVLALLGRPYFGRLWVLQEVALAPTNICYCGTLKFDLLSVLRVARWLTFKLLHLPFSVTRSTGRGYATLMWDFADREQGIHSPASSRLQDLTNILGKNKFAEATEPKDMVFGILGLLSQSPSLERLPSLLTPDYDKSLGDVYRDATIFAMQERENLYILRRIMHSGDDAPNLEGLLSWVPQYNRKGRRGWDPVPFSAIYSASDDRLISHPMDKGTDPNTLLLNGIPLGKVSKSTAVIDATKCDAEAIYKLLCVAEELASLGMGASDDQNVTCAVAMTLIAGRNAQRKAADESEYSNYAALKRHIREKRKHPPALGALNLTVDNEVRAASQWFWAFMQAANRRRFFVTDTGFIGIGPRQSREDDVVAILYGGMWPFVLRHCDGYYQLLGAAYVHGTMNGEAVHEHQVPKLLILLFGFDNFVTLNP